MKKVYEAFGKDKEDIIDCENDYEAFYKSLYNNIYVDDMIMITRVNDIPRDSIINENAIWSINGIESSNDDKESVIIFEPLIKQINNGIKNISSINTSFNNPVKLSRKSIILISDEKYNRLSQDKETKKQIKKRNVRVYEGNEKIAVKMIMHDKRYIQIDVDKNGYIINEKNRPDLTKFIKAMTNLQNVTNEKIKEGYKADVGEEKENIIKEIDEDDNSRMITGLGRDVEGKIEIDNNLYASTDIGKTRENQEDAVLLIKDKENPDFKMMVLADGMGGWKKGEIASDIIVRKMKEWFENLSIEQKQSYYTGISHLKNSLLEQIKSNIQLAVEEETSRLGGSTVVCALIGKEDTLIANVGDSRAYIAKDGKLIQVSREDTVAEAHLKEGKIPEREAARFDEDSNQIVQCIGMRNEELKPYVHTIKNSEYDMLLLFSDGVTDCLSDEDIITVCKNTNRKELASRIVEKAIRHDSLLPEKYQDYVGLNVYIPGGKDNTTAAVYVPKDEDINLE